MKKAAAKVQAKAVSTAGSSFILWADGEMERLRGLLVERGGFADDLKILFERAARSVADAKRDIADLERVRALVANGQAQPDTGGAVNTKGRGRVVLPIDYWNRVKK